MRQRPFPLLLGGLLALLLAGPPALAGISETAAVPPLDSAQERDLARVESYLEQLDTLHARFVQTSSQGDYAEGELVLDRPGKARFEYDPPTPILMIARDGTLLYYNKELEQASFVPLSRTPLRFLTEPDLKLRRDAEVTAIERSEATISVTLAEQGREHEGSLTLVFSEAPLTLRQWQIVDPEGTAIRVALVEPRFNVAVDPSLFDYGDLDIYGFRGGDRGR